MKQEITLEQLQDIIKSRNNNYSENIIIIKNKIIYCKKELEHLNKIENIIFINCEFHKVDINHCQINNCQFIDCYFGDLYMNNCFCNNVSFINSNLHNNTSIVNNVFDHFRGQNISCDCKGVVGNFFKNTDFSGSEGIYYRSDGNRLEWSENFFVNSSIDLASIIRLYNHHPRYIMHIHNYIGKLSKTELLPGVYQRITHGSVAIDLLGLSKEEQLNIIAGLFTNFSEEEIIDIDRMRDISASGENSDENVIWVYGSDQRKLYCYDKRSKVYLRTVENPYPISIVDSYGNRLKPNVIKQLNLEAPFLSNCINIWGQ